MLYIYITPDWVINRLNRPKSISTLFTIRFFLSDQFFLVISIKKVSDQIKLISGLLTSLNVREKDEQHLHLPMFISFMFIDMNLIHLISFLTNVKLCKTHEF